MARVFISSSTRNQELAECFIEFIRLGMGVPKSDIFCTAFPEALPTGENFIEKIRTELESCDAVISLITEEYLRSTFCIVEMGIAWGMRKCYFPLLFVPYERLNSTPLCGVQMRCLDSREDISTVYDELFESHVIKGRQTAEFNRRLPAFIERMSGLKQGNYRIGMDKDGYYTAVIREVRKVSDNYRCYGIKGQKEVPEGAEYLSATFIIVRLSSNCGNLKIFDRQDADESGKFVFFVVFCLRYDIIKR